MNTFGDYWFPSRSLGTSSTLTEAWPGTGPDVAAAGETAVVAWGTQGQGDEETGGGINTRVISLPRSP